MPISGGVYQRGDFYLDQVRGKDGKPASPNFYICWYDPAAGRIQRRSTRTADVQVAIEALNSHYVAVHQPDEDDKSRYTVHQAMIDYWKLHGSQCSSSEAIHARLKLVTRFIAHEIEIGRIREPFLPATLDEEWLKRFRTWATEIDPITQKRRDPETGEWTESTRPRSKATVEESVIAIKAALQFNEKRMTAVPKLKHLTRAQVTPDRNYRLSVNQIAEMLDYAAAGDPSLSPAHAVRLIPLHRYLIGSICTLARPDAIYDISVLPDRGQWQREAGILDLNPRDRLQTRKYRPAVPINDLLAGWLAATDDRLICNESTVHEGDDSWLVQRAVADIKKAWAAMARRFNIPVGYGSKLMRHSMATLVAQRGVPPTEISLAMGHVVLPPSTRRYVIFNPTYLSHTRQAIDDIIADLTQKATMPLHAKDTQVGPDGRRRLT